MFKGFSYAAALLGLAFFTHAAQAAPACSTIAIAPATTIPSATAGTAYGPQSFTASGSSATPYAYDISSGLPASSGLTINSSSGQLSGTPNIAGNFLMTVTATDTNGCTGGRTYELDVAVGDQTITYTSVPPSATVGGPTYTVTATATSNLPVTFSIDATATSVCSISGSTVSFLTVGTCVIDANQAGNASFNAAAQVPQSFAVGKGNQTITFTSVPPNNPTIGGPTYTVTATSNSALTVTFTIDATATSVCSISGNTVSFTGSGTCVIDANQAGDANWNAAPVAKQTFGVALASSTTSLTRTAGPNPSVFGQSLTFTATVTGSGSTPTGTVTFKDGATTLGTGTLNGSGVATLTTGALPVGVRSLTAVYSGDTNFAGSVSSALGQTVNQASTTTALSTSKSPTVFGEAVTFTATVVAVAPGAGTPTGTVTFTDTTTSTTLGTGTLNGSGVATLTTSALTTGAHTIQASYGGDTHFATSTATNGQTVNQGGTSTTVSSNTNPSVFGQSVTFTATVAAVAPAAGTPTGTVTFTDTTTATTLGTGTLNGAGQATLSTGALTTGAHTITAAYGGDTNFTTSTSGALTQTVNQAGTTTALMSSVNPSTINQSVTFTATVTASAPGSGTPTGTVTFLDNGSPISGSIALVGGVATFTTSSLGVGSHPITASYSGDVNFTASTGGPLSQSVSLNASTTILTSSQNPSVFGQAVTFTATVSGSAGPATGTVNFLDNGNPIASNVALVAGVATLTTGTLSVGSHPITAVYSGDTTYGGSTSSLLTQTVNQADTTTTVTADFNPSLVGQMVTFTITVAAVAPGSGTPTGTITDLSVDGTTIAPPPTLTLDGSGQVTFATNAIALGTHTITATYSGDVSFLASDNTASPLSQQVNQANTTTTLTTSKTPTVFGESVTFTATVSPIAPGGGTPTGNVAIVIDGTPTTVALSGGQATLTTSTLSVGSHNVVANYAGTPSYAASGSVSLSQQVNEASTTTSATVDVNPAAFGQTVTFFAVVTVASPGSGTPTGMVTFLDNGSSIFGPAPINGSQQIQFSTNTLSVGTHPITVSYSGDVNFLGSTSSLSEVVTKAGTSTAVTADVNPSVVGQNVTFTATVTSGSGTPTGSVTFFDGANPISGSVSLAGGVASFITNSLALGGHNITAVYGGDPSFAGSTSSILTQTVNQADTTTTVTADVNPSVVGQNVTFTITVTAAAPGSGTPTGDITTLKIDGTTVAPPPTLTLDGTGKVTFATSTLALGSHTVVATYGGDANYLGSDNAASPFNQVVNQASTTTTLGTSKSPTVFGESVTFTATVTAQAPGGGTPTGNLTMTVDGSPTTLTLSGGQATLSTSSLTVGSHTVSANYVGTPSYATSSAAVPTTQQVNKADTTTTVASSLNPSNTGNSVTFTATVTATPPGTGIPTGTVTFNDSVSGSLGSGALNGSGQATVSTSALTAGAHTITASYGGSGSFNVSTSSGLTQNVNQPPAITSPATTTFAPGKAGQTFTVNTTGFPTNASMSITTPGPLPSNVTLVNNNNGTATLGGIPAALTQNASPYLFTITANNGVAPNANQPFTLNIVCPTIIVSGAIGAQTFNTAITPATFTQSNGNGTIAWSANAALTTAGLSINSSTGVVSGTPTNTGTFSVTITATDAGGCTGSHTVSVPVGPSAPAQSYTGVGNTQFFITGVAGPPATPAVSSGNTLLNGVTPAGTTVTAASCSANGTLSGVDASGHFIMTPNVSATSVTCTYTVSGDSGGTGTAATTTANLTFTLNNKVWYVSHGSVGTHDGRSNTPFLDMGGGANNLDCTATAAGDFIYIFKGTASTTGVCAMKASQTLIGAGATLNVPTVSPILTVAGAAGNTPTLTGTITVANSDTVDGIDMSTATANALINTAATTGLSLHVRNLTTTTGTGVSMTTAGNTGNITVDSLTVGAAANAINLGSLGGTLTVNAASVTNTTGAAISLAGVTTANFSGTGATAISTNALAATGIVLNGTALNIGAGGLTIATSGGATGVSDTGGTVTIAAGANTFSITNTNAGAGLVATSGGTLTVTGSANTISTATGTALNVANTTIGGSNVTFKSISANGGSNGIFLNNTGASGGLQVTGTIGSVANDGSGGTIQNMTGADAAPVETASIGVGVYLNSTKNPSLNHMNLHDFSNYAVNGINVTGFTMTYSTVNGTNGTNVGGNGEGDVYFSGLAGSATVDHSNFSGGIGDTFHVFNNGGQTLNRITFTNCSFATNGVALNQSNDAMVFQATDGTLNVTIQSSSFTGARGDLLQMDLHGTISSDLVLGGATAALGNAFSNNNLNIVSGGGGLTLGGGGAADSVTFTYNISNNSFRDAHGSELGIGAGTGVVHNFTGSITNNTFGVSNVVDSGGSQGSGIGIIQSSAGTNTVTITGNQIYQYNNNGILLQMGAFGNIPATYLNATVKNNTINNPGTFGSQGVMLNAGTGGTDVGKACLDLSGNAMTGSGGNGATDIRVRSRFGVRVGLPGYGGISTDTAAVSTFLSGNNGGASASAGAPATGGYFGSCPP